MSAATIIAAIDSAIESWAGKPVQLSVNGRSVTYRSLDELLAARKYYVSLNSSSSDARSSFKICNFQPKGMI